MIKYIKYYKSEGERRRKRAKVFNGLQKGDREMIRDLAITRD
jgi:hypothetical protein